jgi:hypothetical protein
VMIEIISTPGAISRVTSQFTAPSITLVTFPFSTLRGADFHNWAGLFQTGCGIAIELSHHSQTLHPVGASLRRECGRCQQKLNPCFAAEKQQ